MRHKDPTGARTRRWRSIADKLAIDRPSNGDISAPEPPSRFRQSPRCHLNKSLRNRGPTQQRQRKHIQPNHRLRHRSACGHHPICPYAAAPAVPIPVTVNVKRQPVRDALVTYSVAIAVLSLVLSIYQGYLFHESLALSNQSIDVMQRNVARGEFSRACRDIIETYFQVKQKVSVLMPAADRSNVAGASRVTEASRLEAQGAIAKFGGLGTYLANFQDAATRARYTELTRTLIGIMDSARTTPLPDIDKMFQPADKMFGQMNEDCARLSRTMRM